MRYIYGFIIVSIFCGCGRDENSELSIIVDNDDRTEIYEHDDKIGSFVSESVCTAFAVSSRTIITAEHCFNKNVGGQYLTKNNSYYVVKVTSQHFSADVVELELNKNLKSYFEVTSHNKNLFSRIYSISDEKLLTNESNWYSSIYIEGLGDIEGVFMHKLDTVPGSSGSPIVQNGKVTGIHLGSIYDTNLNYGVELLKLDEIESFKLGTPEAVPIIPFILAGGRACMANTRCMIVAGAVLTWVGNLTHELALKAVDFTTDITKTFVQHTLEMEKLEKVYEYKLKIEMTKAQQAKDKNAIADIKSKPLPNQDGHTITVGNSSSGTSGNVGGGIVDVGNGTIYYDCGYQTGQWVGGRLVTTWNKRLCVAFEAWQKKYLTNAEYFSAVLGGSIYQLWWDNWNINGVPVGPNSESLAEAMRILKRGIERGETKKQIITSLRNQVVDAKKEASYTKPSYKPDCKPNCWGEP